MRRVVVPGAAPYEVVIGPGAQAELGLVLAGTPKAAVVHTPPLVALAGAAVETLQTAGVAAEAVVVPDGGRPRLQRSPPVSGRSSAASG
jgi:3-dehydroquinate synthase